MKKSFVVPFIILLSIPFIMGMGKRSGSLNHKIPLPDKNFAATIIDSQGVSTKVNQVSFDGKTYLAGYRGNTMVTVPFEKIASIDIVRYEENKKITASINLKTGGTLNISVEEKTPCYGSADFGNIQIEFKDIKKVELQGVVSKERP